MNLISLSFMSEDLNSNNVDNNEFNQNSEESDYKNLITRLKGIRRTIVLLEKTIFK